jgi:hypothetical protein
MENSKMPEENIRFTITMTKKEHDEFVRMANQLEGPPMGSRKRGINEAIKIMSNYFKEVEKTTLFQIAKENNIPPWRLGSILIRIAIPVYVKHGRVFFDRCEEIGIKPEDEHLRLADKFFENLEKG